MCSRLLKLLTALYVDQEPFNKKVKPYLCKVADFSKLQSKQAQIIDLGKII